jgi:hypothetical protein
VPMWGASTYRFLVQHHQTSLSGRLVYVRLQFSRPSYDDDGFSGNHNKGHQTDAYQSTHHTLALHFNTVSQKVIGHKELGNLKAYMIETMCMFEMCFPPFFDMQEHLMIYLVDQILTLGPLYLHNMFSYEWFLAVLKAYVRNRAHPKDSIMEGYTIEELVECCTDYVEDRKWIGLPIPLHEGRFGRLRGRGRMSQKTFVDRDYNLVSEAHFSVLQQLMIAALNIDEHLSEL